MKLKNKVGFTLLEMVIVLAIIAAIIGVVISARQYIDWAHSRSELAGENMDQWDRVRAELEASQPTQLWTAEPTTSDTGMHYGGGDNPGGNPGGGGNPGNPTVAEPSTSDTEPSVIPPSDPTVHDSGENAPGSGYSVNSHLGWFGSRLTFIDPMTECIVMYDGTDELKVDAAGKYTVEDLGDNHYKIKYVAGDWGGDVQPLKEIPIHVSTDYTTFYIESYESDV